MEYTDEQRQQARAELARRELARRQKSAPQPQEEDSGAYLDSLPPPEGFFHKLPRNIVAGLANLGHTTINLPHDLAQGLESSTQGIGNTINQALPFPAGLKQQQFNLSEHMPHQQEYDFAQMLGQKGEGTMLDNLIQKGVEYAPEIAGLGGLLRGGVRRLKGTHQLDKVEKSVLDKGLTDFGYSPQMIKQAEKFLPKTESTKELMTQVKAGNYKPAFKLQSQIGHHERQLAKSPLASENSIMAPKAGELKQNMLGHLGEVLRKANLHEEADLLKTGINNYRQYKKFMGAVMPVLKYAGVPTTILAAIPFAYKKGTKLMRD